MLTPANTLIHPALAPRTHAPPEDETGILPTQLRLSNQVILTAPIDDDLEEEDEDEPEEEEDDLDDEEEEEDEDEYEEDDDEDDDVDDVVIEDDEEENEIEDEDEDDTEEDDPDSVKKLMTAGKSASVTTFSSGSPAMSRP